MNDFTRIMDTPAESATEAIWKTPPTTCAGRTCEPSNAPPATCAAWKMGLEMKALLRPSMKDRKSSLEIGSKRRAREGE